MMTLKQMTEEFEKKVIMDVISTSASLTEARDRLGLSPQGIYNKLKRYNLPGLQSYRVFTCPHCGNNVSWNKNRLEKVVDKNNAKEMH